MAMRPAVGIVNQYAVETTRGTGVTAAKKLVASFFRMSKEYANSFFRIPGSIFPTTGVRHRAWSSGRLEGILSYEEAHLQLAMMFVDSVITTPNGTARTHTFTVPSTPGGSWRSITGQAGDAVAAREVNYLSLASYGIEFGGDTIGVSGDCVGKAVDTGATLDTLTTTLPEQPVSGSDVHYYIDAASANLGTTEWLQVFEASLSFPTNKSPAFVQGASSFEELVETAMEDARLVIRCADTTQARAIETAMDTDQKPFRYIRINADGDTITGSTSPYRWRGNFAVKLESCTDIPDVQAVYGLEFTFKIMHSAEMTRACDFAVTNTQTAL
jgi:hypothetical protein